jgi:glycosyltransferase involved in cell wall biosynthesis
MFKVAIITTQHSVNDMRVTHRIGKTFSELGYKVTWLGPMDKYNSDTDYGINFEYLKSSSRVWRFFELFQILKKKERYDLYWSVDPDSAWIAQYIGRLKKSISLFDIHERYHDDILRSRIKSDLVYFIAKSIFYKYLKYVVRNTDVLVGVGETRLAPFVGLMKNQFVIKHYLPKSFCNITVPKSLPENGKLLIMHGKAAASRGTEQILTAIEKLKEFDVDNVEFQFFKLSGVQSAANMEFLELDLKNRGLSDLVRIWPPVSFKEMTTILVDCHIGIIAYKKDLGVNAMPNRFFEYIAFGMPVIFPNYSLELMDIHQKFEIGIPVDMEDSNAICLAIQFLMDNPEEYSRLSQNCLDAFKVLNFENEFRDFDVWLKNKNQNKI